MILVSVRRNFYRREITLFLWPMVLGWILSRCDCENDRVVSEGFEDVGDCYFLRLLVVSFDILV